MPDGWRLLQARPPETDSKIDENKIKGYKHFANKLWNIARFVLENTQDFDGTAPTTDSDEESSIAPFKELLKDITR